MLRQAKTPRDGREVASSAVLAWGWGWSQFQGEKKKHGLLYYTCSRILYCSRFLILSIDENALSALARQSPRRRKIKQQ
jgi:hypothetical protein